MAIDDIRKRLARARERAGALRRANSGACDHVTSVLESELEASIAALPEGDRQRAKLERELDRLREPKPQPRRRAMLRTERPERPVEAIIQLSVEGAHIRDIAQQLGIPVHHVVEERRKLGLGNIRARKVKEDIARLNSLGMNDGQIATELGLSRPHVCNIRNALNIAPVAK